MASIFSVRRCVGILLTNMRFRKQRKLIYFISVLCVFFWKYDSFDDRKPDNNVFSDMEERVTSDSAYVKQVLEDLAVGLAVKTIEIVGCANSSSGNPVLKLDSRDCALFCLGRGYQYVNLNPMRQKCFCSNSTRKKFDCSTEGKYKFFTLKMSARRAIRDAVG